MKKFFDSCYMWMQAYLVARSCSENIMFLNCDTNKLNDEQLTRYEEIVGKDLKSGVFGDYILFRFSVLLEIMAYEVAKDREKAKNNRYNGMNILDLAVQTVDTLAMVSDALFAFDGRFIHRVYNKFELSNIRAFNKYDGRNLKSFAQLLNTMIESQDNYEAMKTAAIVYNILAQIEEMVFDIEYVLMHKQDIINKGAVTYGDLNKFIDIVYDKIKDGVENIYNLYENSYAPQEHMDMKALKSKMDSIKFIIDTEIIKVKIFGLETEPIDLYKNYAKHLDRYIKPDVVYDGLSQTILEWLDCNNT